MSSGFVSGGTIDNPVERDDEWLKAQKELDAKRLREKEQKDQQGGKSLYETLQANKAAKQEAFEESIKLKNQFRPLDEHEVEFLDSVLSTTRAQEAAVQKETSEQLDLFRKQQEQAQKTQVTERSEKSPIEEGERWTSGPKKRKREKETIPGVKLRKSSSATQEKETALLDTPAKTSWAGAASRDRRISSEQEESQEVQTQAIPSRIQSSGTAAISTLQTLDKKPPTSAKVSSSQATGGGLGLGNYSSDEDD